MITVFSLSYQFLTKFCYKQKDNQLELYNYMELYTKTLEIDCRQMDLIATIFFDNHELIEEIPDYLFDIFLNLILDEGR